MTNDTSVAPDEQPCRGRGRAQATLTLIDATIDILDAIHPASVRAVCYQLFTRKLIPSMARKETNRVSRILRDARERNELPWSWIVDETREAERVNAWENPNDFVEAVRRSYRRDRWADQPCRVEVWSEKGTIRGTLAPVLNEYGVTFRVMHGYGSATALYGAAQECMADHRPWEVLYVGDWDPSGLAMSEVDLPDRLDRYGGYRVYLRRLAIDARDTRTDLPSFSASEKKQDPRYAWFVSEYGHRCWELDALNPVELRDRVRLAIAEFIDHAAWDRADVVEKAEQESLTTILKAWPTISRRASNCDDAD
jgi:hypothetical protein